MKHKTAFLLAAVCLLATPLIMAQQAAAPQGPPPMLQIFREEIKPGHRGAYMQSAGQWPAVFRKANFPGHYLALNSISGPAEVWYLAGADSFAKIQRDDDFIANNEALRTELDRLSASDGQHMNGARTVIARLRSDLGYGAPADISKMRYFTIVTTRIRPGHGPAYTEMMRKVKDAHARANMTETYAVYEVVSGAPAGTMLMFIPTDSLKRVDELNAEHAQKLQPVFSDEERELMRKTGAEGVIFAETTYFQVSPGLSYPPANVVAGDPGFWSPKAETAKKAKKSGKEVAAQ